MNAAFSSADSIGKLVDGVKSKSEAFKGLAKSKRVDHKSVYFNKMQLAESIANCRPDGLSNAEELLAWLVKVNCTTCIWQE